MIFDLAAMVAARVSVFYRPLDKIQFFPTRTTTVLKALSVLLLAAGFLSGCGGGGGGEAGNPVTAPLVLADSDSLPLGRTYLPNYVSNLAAVRRWDKPVVTVRVLSPSGRDMTPLVQQAIDLWNSKVGQNITLRVVPVSATNTVDVTIRWVDPMTLAADSVGRTEVTFRLADQILTSAQVQVSSSLPDLFQVQVIAHELGHALGIQGHSTENADLMYANAHLPTIITTSDENTIHWAYEGTRSVSAQAGRTSGPAAPEADLRVAQSVCGTGG